MIRGHPEGYPLINSLAVLLFGMNSLYRAYISTCTAIGAYIRVDFIDITF